MSRSSNLFEARESVVEEDCKKFACLHEKKKKSAEKGREKTHGCLTRIPLFRKDDVFYRGRGAIAACDATTTTTTTRNTETNARGDFPASLSEK